MENSYRGISSDQVVLTKTAMNELRVHVFHSTEIVLQQTASAYFPHHMAANNSGEAVVQCFRGQTDTQPRVARLSEWKMTTRGQRAFADGSITVVCGVYVAWVKTGYTVMLLLYQTVITG